MYLTDLSRSRYSTRRNELETEQIIMIKVVAVVALLVVVLIDDDNSK